MAPSVDTASFSRPAVLSACHLSLVVYGDPGCLREGIGGLGDEDGDDPRLNMALPMGLRRPDESPARPDAPTD